jgi:hypothetical protein
VAEPNAQTLRGDFAFGAENRVSGDENKDRHNRSHLGYDSASESPVITRQASSSHSREATRGTIIVPAAEPRRAAPMTYLPPNLVASHPPGICNTM